MDELLDGLMIGCSEAIYGNGQHIHTILLVVVGIHLYFLWRYL